MLDHGVRVTAFRMMAVLLLLGMVGGCQEEESQEHHEEGRKVVATSPKVMDVTVTQRYVCQIHSQRHISIRALESGYLEEIKVKEGQSVKQGDLLFQVMPTLYQARLDAELAEAKLAQLEYNNTKRLLDEKVVSPNELMLSEAKLAKAQAKAKLAAAELNFAQIRAPFDGIIDRLREQQGSLIEEGAILTTLSDNRLMWVYFNVPEAMYLEYKSSSEKEKQDRVIELVLANGNKFPHSGKIGAIEADFNNETGNIAFRADFPNPDGLLRHGQTGNVLIKNTLPGATVIPQRCSFETLDKRYVYVIGEDHSVSQREIAVESELEDIFVLKDGIIKPEERILLEGVQQVHEGEKVEYEFIEPNEVLGHLKFKAE